MKYLKVLSIVGIIWFSVCLLLVIAYIDKNDGIAAVWGFCSVIFAIPYSVSVFFVLREYNTDVGEKLRQLMLSNEKGILNRDEFLKKANVMLDEFISQEYTHHGRGHSLNS